MSIQLIEGDAHVKEKAHRFESALSAVNARIVFLAGLVGVQLESETEVQHILDRDNAVFKQVHIQLSHTEHHGGHANRALQREWEELRGLMVLRCDLVTHALEALGLELTHQITTHVEKSLEAKGIKPGADGFGLHLQMDRIVNP